MADKKQKILIVDDSEMNRDILAVMLGSDYEILEAENGLEAIEILQQGMTDIDLILLDIMMPEMDGFDVLGFMKRSHMTEVIPVIMISTMADETTGLYKVKASVDADVVLPTGSEVKLYVTSEKAEGVMTIPVDAVYYENGEPYVYTYSDGKVWQKFIEEGIFDSDILEVKSGLSMDDMVVTTWSSELYDGAEVRLKGETTQDDSTGDAAGAPAGGPEGNAPGGPGAPMTGNKAQ